MVLSGRRSLPSLLPVAAVNALAVAVTLANAGPTYAAPVPDSLRQAMLLQDAHGMNRCRVVTSRNDYEFSKLKMDSLGVIMNAPEKHPAILTDPHFVPDPPKRISWSEIERIEGTRSHATSGFFMGAIVGGIVGTALAVRSLDHGGGEGEGAVPIAWISTGVLVGGVTGAMLASTSGWKPLYP